MATKNRIVLTKELVYAILKNLHACGDAKRQFLRIKSIDNAYRRMPYYHLYWLAERLWDWSSNHKQIFKQHFSGKAVDVWGDITWEQSEIRKRISLNQFKTALREYARQKKIKPATKEEIAFDQEWGWW